MIHDEIWLSIIPTNFVPVPNDPEQPFLFPVFQVVNTPFWCAQCIERRLGRRLKQEDLTTCAYNESWIEDRKRGSEER
jgi:hypothetical protein